jgi:hypothetical protein
MTCYSKSWTPTGGTSSQLRSVFLSATQITPDPNNDEKAGPASIAAEISRDEGCAGVPRRAAEAPARRRQRPFGLEP